MNRKTGTARVSLHTVLIMKVDINLNRAREIHQRLRDYNAGGGGGGGDVQLQTFEKGGDIYEVTCSGLNSFAASESSLKFFFKFQSIWKKLYSNSEFFFL